MHDENATSTSANYGAEYEPAYVDHSSATYIGDFEEPLSEVEDEQVSLQQISYLLQTYYI